MSDLDTLENSGRGITLETIEASPERGGARFMAGSLNEQVEELIRILREKEKVLPLQRI